MPPTKKVTQVYTKRAHSAPPIEEMKKFDCYAISINPSDRYQWTEVKDDEHRFRQTLLTLLVKLKNIRGVSALKLYTEISSSGRIHFHGLINFNDLVKFYTIGFRQLSKFGTFEIDFIKDQDVWTKYCSKQKEVLEGMFNSLQKYNLKNPCNVMKWEHPDSLKDKNLTIYDYFTKHQIDYILNNDGELSRPEDSDSESV